MIDLRRIFGISKPNSRDIQTEIEERDKTVATKIAQRMEVDALEQLMHSAGLQEDIDIMQEKLDTANKIRTREEDWSKVIDQNRIKEMYSIWRRT